MMRSQRGLLLVLALLVATLIVGQYVDAQTDAQARQNLRIRLDLERMVRLNAQLTDMVTIAVAQRNALRAAPYATLAAELDTTLQSLEQQTRGMALAGEVGALRREQQSLRQAEQGALAHLQAQQWDDAAQTLKAADYQVALKIYQIDSQAAVGALTLELNASGRHIDQLRLATLVARLAALVLLLGVGFRHARRLRAELAEQTRLRSALTGANAQLEERVQQRTEELRQANQKLAELVDHDALTGLASRRRLEDRWDEEWKRALRQGTSLAVIVLDVDHFKRYNDALGHAAGDACLQAVAQVVKNAARRAGELAARQGGEEFVLVLPGATVRGALDTAQYIQESLAAAKLPHPASPIGAWVTCSLGVAVDVPDPDQPRDHLLVCADRALYSAKDEGRNAISLARTRALAAG